MTPMKSRTNALSFNDKNESTVSVSFRDSSLESTPRRIGYSESNTLAAMDTRGRFIHGFSRPLIWTRENHGDHGRYGCNSRSSFDTYARTYREIFGRLFGKILGTISVSRKRFFSGASNAPKHRPFFHGKYISSAETTIVFAPRCFLL